MSKVEFFTPEQEASIVAAIKEAELNTSGEIRVHLERHTQKDNLARAQEVFDTAGMGNTKSKNGVLFYFAIEDKQFSVLGDSGINELVPDDFWKDIVEAMRDHFKKGEFDKGLITGISMTGKALKEFFPYEDDDENELSDEISKS